jgi:hypothetical protein
MASSTSYLSTVRVTLSFVYPIHALFVAHVCLVIVVFDHEYDGTSCFIFIRRSDLLRLVSGYLEI